MPSLSFKKGEIILQEAPYAAAVNDVSLQTICAYCFEEATVEPCSKCKTVGYCSRECKRKDHDDHAMECYAMTHESARNLDTECRLVIRAIAKHHRELAKNSVSVGNWFGIKRSIIHLLSHLDHLVQNPRKYAETAAKARRILAVIQDKVPCTYEEVLAMIMRMRINTFGASTSTGLPSVVAVHLAASKFDHSCEPQIPVTHLFNKRKICFRAVEDFTCEREDLKISYLPPLMSYPARQERLLSHYYFECGCQKCWDDYNAGAKEDCPPEIIEELETLLACGDQDQIYEEGTKILERMTGLPEDNYWVYQLRCALQAAAFVRGEFYESLQHGYHAFIVTPAASYQATILYSMYLALHELGWNQKSHEHHDYFVECVKKGERLFDVCFGKRHTIASELRRAVRSMRLGA
ncbi:histone-lysine N-methyltransferase ASHR1-like [Galendromus occidentalis]|uniref:Histone-lysine N-methyltransferase ASHR1-like n=1 Tax=Galendromus occidentalis TaxID=34638 RepID=A0AAJ7PAK4_9ACAR|nr:histone-lysine N-methyltransferase ASHR1-like [Galendromus occidentalis]